MIELLLHESKSICSGLLWEKIALKSDHRSNQMYDDHRVAVVTLFAAYQNCYHM